MKIVKPGFNIMDHGDHPLTHIERIGRICYKSEDKIADGTAAKFVGMLFRNRHYAMLEHYRFVLRVDQDTYDQVIYDKPKYLCMSNINSPLISGSARAFLDILAGDEYDDIYDIINEFIHLISYMYNCPALFGELILDSYDIDNCTTQVLWNDEIQALCEEEYQIHGWMSVHFVCDRGVSHEIVRHRDASFAQESTRYVNYGGTDIAFIEPPFWGNRLPYAHINTPEWIAQKKYSAWINVCEVAEDEYNILISFGAQPQEARSVLPNSLKTEIVVTATMSEWIHIFKLRALGETGKPHPQMVEIMMPLYTEYMLRHMDRISRLED